MDCSSVKPHSRQTKVVSSSSPTPCPASPRTRADRRPVVLVVVTVALLPAHANAITLRMPSCASISSKPRLTSSSVSVCDTNGVDVDVAVEARRTSSGTWSRPLTPPNDEPHTRRPGDQIARNDVERLALARDARDGAEPPAHPRGLDGLAHHVHEPGRLEGVVGAEPARALEDLGDGVGPAGECLGRALARARARAAPRRDRRR